MLVSETRVSGSGAAEELMTLPDRVPPETCAKTRLVTGADNIKNSHEINVLLPTRFLSPVRRIPFFVGTHSTIKWNRGIPFFNFTSAETVALWKSIPRLIDPQLRAPTGTGGHGQIQAVVLPDLAIVGAGACAHSGGNLGDALVPVRIDLLVNKEES